MGTFIVAFIGNGFVASAQDSPLLSKLSPKARRRLLVLLYFTVRNIHKCSQLGLLPASALLPALVCLACAQLGSASLATSIARLAARR